MIITTVMILRRDNKLLLGLKKRGFGAGKLTFPGGKLEKGETIMRAAIRETQEEIGVTVNSCKPVGRIVFRNLYYKGQPETDIMHVYYSEDFSGEPVETDEIKPEWITVDNIPYNKLWADDEYWLPAVLRGHFVDAFFRYNEKNEFAQHEVNELSDNEISHFSDELFGFSVEGDPDTFVDRYAARAVLVDDNWRVGLMDATNCGFYKLPGGGIDNDETILEALRREVQEEAGYEIEELKPLGYILETRSHYSQINHSYIYLARATKNVGATPMEDEIEDGFELKWFNNIDAAIEALKHVDTSTAPYRSDFFTARELAALRAARQVMKEQYGQ